MPIEIRKLTAGQTRSLRAEILRPGVAPEDVHFPGEDAPGAQHFGAFDGETLVGVAFITPSEWEEKPAFQLRGVSVKPEFRRAGVATELVKACLESAGEKLVWCNARIGALGLYEKLGFQKRGEEFEIEGIGAHWVMVKN